MKLLQILLPQIRPTLCRQIRRCHIKDGLAALLAFLVHLVCRACVCHDAYSAKQAVEHDALNVLCMGARIIGPAVAEELTERFLSASFLTGTRHEIRLNKVKAIENANFK